MNNLVYGLVAIVCGIILMWVSKDGDLENSKFIGGTMIVCGLALIAAYGSQQLNKDESNKKPT